jgi:hypothetical protein
MHGPGLGSLDAAGEPVGDFRRRRGAATVSEAATPGCAATNLRPEACAAAERRLRSFRAVFMLQST